MSRRKFCCTDATVTNILKIYKIDISLSSDEEFLLLYNSSYDDLNVDYIGDDTGTNSLPGYNMGSILLFTYLIKRVSLMSTAFYT